MTTEKQLAAEEAQEVRASIHIMGGLTNEIYSNPQGPFVSLYLPVHHQDRAGGRNWWDDIELKDLVKQAQADLERDFTGEYDGIKQRLTLLEEHPNWFVWENAKDAIAFLVSNTDVYVFPLDIQIPDKGFVTVGNEFFIKPLVRNYERACHYYLLLLSNDHFAFVEGDEETINRMPMPAGVKDEYAELWGTYDGHEAALDYQAIVGHESPFHNFQSRNDVKKEEGEYFFRYVNKAVNDTFKDHDATPVILVCLPEHLAEFKKVCTIHDVLPEAIEKDPGALDAKQLLADAVAIMNKHEAEALQQLRDTYNEDAAHDKASDDIDTVAKAIFEDQVATLMLAKGKIIPGSYDPQDGSVNFDTATDPADDKLFDPASPDVTDGLAQAALQHGGEVIVLPQEQMPTASPVAAVFRYEVK